MAGILKNKKIMIGVLCALAVVAIVLVIIIIKVNSDNEDEIVVENTGTESGVVTESEIDKNNPTSTQENNSEITASPDTTSMPVPTSEPTEENIKVILGQYKGIKAEYAPVQVTDETIEKNLEDFRYDSAYYKTITDREFVKDDMVIVTVDAYVGENIYDDLSVYCIQDVIGTELLPKFIEDEIIGKHVGDEFEIEKEYPEDYSAYPDIAGKTVLYKVELVDGFELFVPELSDSLVLDSTDGEFKTIEEYRTKGKEKLQEEENNKAHDIMVENIKKTMVSSCVFEGDINSAITRCFVEKIQEMNTWANENYMMDGATYYLLAFGISASDYQKMMMDEASFEVEYNYALNAIVEEEGLDKAYPGATTDELLRMAEELIINSAEVENKD